MGCCWTGDKLCYTINNYVNYSEWLGITRQTAFVSAQWGEFSTESCKILQHSAVSSRRGLHIHNIVIFYYFCFLPSNTALFVSNPANSHFSDKKGHHTIHKARNPL